MSETTKETPRWLGWVVIVLAVIVCIQTAISQHNQHEESAKRAATVRCLSDWATHFQNALDARTGASTATTKLRAQFDAAAAQVFAAVPPVLEPTPAPGSARNLQRKLSAYADAYRAVQHASKDQRDAATDHPYPDPPARCVN